MALYSIETYGELQPYLQQEWLIANGMGGYAAGTVVGCNTRRYHGLLCAATLPPVGRVMLLNRMGEILSVAGQEDRLIELSICQFDETFHPRGDRYLRRFDKDDAVATWTYEAEGIAVTKQVFMPWLKNSVGIRYRIEPDHRQVQLRLLPFVRMADFHTLRHEKAAFDVQNGPESCTIKLNGQQLVIVADAGSFRPHSDWWYGHHYALETERGLDDREDLFTPGEFVFSISKPTTVTLWAGVDSAPRLDWDEQLIERRKMVTVPAKSSETVLRLSYAANDFISIRKSPDGSMGSTVIAGYPWFADWGRDTMISLPGLLLCRQKFETARQVLSVFAQYVSEGMIPNRFDDYTNEPSYNTVDASLWFVHACFEYARLSGDSRTMTHKLEPACAAIIKGYTQGTRFHIHVDPADGLLCQGDGNTQLTWMDAKCDGVAFTPRQGKPVEINALWYHALCLMGDTAQAQRVAESFRKAFWLNPFRGLADVVDGSRRDASLRPNQIFAVSLPNSPLELPQQQAVVEAVRRELLTPMGLRTLDRSDPKYHGSYIGPQRQRDEAYHNGAVWPWLIGAFLDAYLRVHENSPAAQEQARRWLLPLIERMQTACIGQIGEIFEGNEPHRPVGCFAQAWSVAEVLRLAMRLGM